MWKQRVGSSKGSKCAQHIKSSSVGGFVGYMEARLVLTLHLFFFFHVKLNDAANIL